MARLDQALVDRGIFESREKAKRAIMAGTVRINNQSAHKPSDPVREQDSLTVETPERYVSRGGHKLEHALQHFQIDVRNLTALDLGASTGGFTDCLIQNGIAHVYSVDVGRGQLAWTLRQDPRVIVMEKTNARHLTAKSFPPTFRFADIVTIDCSFISLQKIIPPAVALLGNQGRIIALIKPQFEAGKAEADRGAGVISDPEVHRKVVEGLRLFVTSLPKVEWLGVTESPLLGPAGNREFLALLEKTK